MAVATYLGPKFELAFALPIPKDGEEVRPWPFRGKGQRNEAVVLEPGQPRRVHRWVALWLAAMRRKVGPWVRVRFEPGEWVACQRQAPWVKKVWDFQGFTQPQGNAWFWQAYAEAPAAPAKKTAPRRPKAGAGSKAGRRKGRSANLPDGRSLRNRATYNTGPMLAWNLALSPEERSQRIRRAALVRWPAPEVRFAAFIEPEPNSGCWLWYGPSDRLGYGRFRLRGRLVSAHRFAYELEFGQLEQAELDHLCRNRRCVSPWHLEPVSHQENCRRAQALRQSCPHGHPLDGYKCGQRFCRTCHRESSRAYQRRRRASRLA